MDNRFFHTTFQKAGKDSVLRSFNLYIDEDSNFSCGDHYKFMNRSEFKRNIHELEYPEDTLILEDNFDKIYFFPGGVLPQYRGMISEFNRKFKNIKINILEEGEIKVKIRSNRLWSAERIKVFFPVDSKEKVLFHGEKLSELTTNLKVPVFFIELNDGYSNESKVYLNYLMSVFILSLNMPSYNSGYSMEHKVSQDISIAKILSSRKLINATVSMDEFLSLDNIEVINEIFTRNYLMRREGLPITYALMNLLKRKYSNKFWKYRIESTKHRYHKFVRYDYGKIINQPPNTDMELRRFYNRLLTSKGRTFTKKKSAEQLCNKINRIVRENTFIVTEVLF